MNSEIEGLVRSYARLSHDVGGRINFACDLDNEDALTAAEREKSHLDQAFFVLSFAALENQITSLACAREPAERRRLAMRDADFAKRWDAAVKIAQETLGGPPGWNARRPIVFSWYKIRSDIAHGSPPSELTDVPAVLYRADEIASTLGRVVSTLQRGA